MRTREPEIWKGVVAGAVAGLAATWAMTQFQVGWSKLKEKRRQPPDEESQNDQGQAEDATMKTAAAIARNIFGKDLTVEQKRKLGPIVHYGFGAVMGAIYGGMKEEFDNTSIGWGTAFGSALFLGADEAAIPLLGLGGSPTKSPLSTHLYAWSSHLVYGATLESVRRPLRSSMGYDDVQSRISGVAEAVRDRMQDYAGQARRRARPYMKSTLKSVEKTARRMRKAA